ncbi:MAG: DNA primase, partial [Candidatus Cloacimonetes bacterium]|nr:DNA primase [Candidatus Cloacimonadota bacterium]
MEAALIEEIRQANNIIDVVGSYIPIKRSGSSFKAQCPFHDDTHPSMMISDKKQIFKCFVCGKGGNVFTFVQEYEHISFIEAVKKLAERVGIKVEEDKKTQIVRTKNQLLIAVYDEAKSYFVENLNKFGESVINYLEKRGISRQVIKNFDIGYALDSYGGLKGHLLNKHFGTDILKASGLFGNNENGYFDLFRERLIFPIHSSTGKVVAFGGRKLNDEQPGGKYINSPTTAIYTKGKELYGFFLTKFDISKKGFAIICEGYMDFLRLYSTGYTNCVASLGTALTDDQLKLLKQFTSKLYMAYDGDDAGLKAAIRGSIISISQNYRPYIIELPTGEDPDSYLLKNGVESFNELIDKALPFIDFYASSSKIKLDKKARIDE